MLQDFFWIGLPLVVAGVCLLLVKGYENKGAQAGPAGEWRTATRKELERILSINREQNQWDKDVLDITCGRGCIVLLLIIGAMVIGAVLLVDTVQFEILEMVVANAAVCLLPFWVTGVRFILKNDDLVVKVTMLLEIEAAFQAGKKEGEEIQFQLQTRKAQDGSGDVPTDTKAVLQFRNAPAEFLGVQMQVAINNVQGTSYPYYYCVLVARPAFGGLKPRPAPTGIVIEDKREGDVDIAVVRQATSKTSGYHTDAAAARRVFECALGEARRALAGRK
jgi:hypothetical protein